MSIDSSEPVMTADRVLGRRANTRSCSSPPWFFARTSATSHLGESDTALTIRVVSREPIRHTQFPIEVLYVFVINHMENMP